MYAAQSSQNIHPIQKKKSKQDKYKPFEFELLSIISTEQMSFSNNSVPINYLITRMNKNTFDVYDALLHLLSAEKVNRVYSSRCPECHHENITNDENTAVVRCQHCNLRYGIDSIEEKFSNKLEVV